MTAKSHIAIYYEAGLLQEANRVKQIIENIFPHIKANVLGSKELPVEAWDTLKVQYDVHCLFEYWQVPAGSSLTLWLVDKDIGEFWHRYLFGAAADRKAIVSTARLERLEDVAKEVCHEVGHMLGLTHCNRECLMQTSWTTGDVARKSEHLCEECRMRLRITGKGFKRFAYVRKLLGRGKYENNKC